MFNLKMMNMVGLALIARRRPHPPSFPLLLPNRFRRRATAATLLLACDRTRRCSRLLSENLLRLAPRNCVSSQAPAAWPRRPLLSSSPLVFLAPSGYTLDYEQVVYEMISYR